ncbi:LysE family translocator [Rhodovibrionaceae bacterium A322]
MAMNLWALLSFALVASITPGPNNVMLTASGANFGYLRTLPHIFGIFIGFGTLIMLVGLGLGSVFQAYPALHEVLRYVGGAYLLYLAWRVVGASLKGEADKARPVTFWEAASFQFANPKAWVMAISSITTFTTPGGSAILESAVVSGSFMAVCVVSTAVWTLFGQTIGRFLTTERNRLLFNGTMAGLLVLCVIALLFADLS